MEAELWSLAKVSLAAAAAMAYARFSSLYVGPGFYRLTSFAPVLALLPFLPFSFATVHLRLTSFFFLTWLGIFKLVLLAFGRGPLDPSLPLLQFVSSATLPVKLRDSDPNPKKPTSHFSPELLLSSGIKAVLLAALVSLYRFKTVMNHNLLLAFYCLHLYLTLELILALAAFVNGLLGMELEQQFDKPFLAASLRDFWGRRWNLMVSAILRPSVYDPVRTRLGVPAGVVAAFLVSGLMHELSFYYTTERPPRWEVTAFFVLHGLCTAVEGWWASHKGWSRPPRASVAPLVLVFVAGTGMWLFFPPLVRSGTDQRVVAESVAMMAFLEEAGQKLLGSAGLGPNRQ